MNSSFTDRSVHDGGRSSIAITLEGCRAFVVRLLSMSFKIPIVIVVLIMRWPESDCYAMIPL